MHLHLGKNVFVEYSNFNKNISLKDPRVFKIKYMLLLKFNDMNRHSYESEILSSRIELDYNFIIYTIFGFCGLLFLWRFTVFLFLIVMEFDIGYYAYMRILLLLSPTICVLLEFGINKFC